MNPGYLTLILISIVFILLASGWKEIILRGASPKVILLFFAGWLICHWFTLRFDGVRINLTFALLVGLTVCLLATVRDWSHLVHLLSIGFMLASFHFLMLEIYRVNPFLSAFGPEADIAFSLSGMAVIINRNPYRQMLILSLALLLGDTYYRFVHRDTVSLYLGDPRFSDTWWLTICTARLATLLMQAVGGAVRRTARAWMERQKGWRK